MEDLAADRDHAYDKTAAGCILCEDRHRPAAGDDRSLRSCSSGGADLHDLAITVVAIEVHLADTVLGLGGRCGFIGIRIAIGRRVGVRGDIADRFPIRTIGAALYFKMTVILFVCRIPDQPYRSIAAVGGKGDKRNGQYYHSKAGGRRAGSGCGPGRAGNGIVVFAVIFGDAIDGKQFIRGRVRRSQRTAGQDNDLRSGIQRQRIILTEIERACYGDINIVQGGRAVEYDHRTGRYNDRVVILGDPVKAPGGGGGPVAAIKYGRVKGTGAGDKTGRDQGQKQQGAEFRFHGSRIKWINHKRQAAYQRLQPCQKSGNSRATDLGIEGYPSINRCLPNAEDPGVFRNFSDYWTKSSFWDAG